MSYNLNVSSQIFDSYLHQDWVDEVGNESDAIKAMTKGETREHIDKVLQEIEALLLSPLTEDELREVLIGRVVFYFEPSF